MDLKRSIALHIVVVCVLTTACWQAKESAVTPGAQKTSVTNTTSEDNPKEEKMTENKSGGFTANLPGGFQMPADPVGRRLLREYGSMFVAKGVTVPTSVMFRDDAAVREFQERAGVSSERLSGVDIELQRAALEALLRAIKEAEGAGRKITPTGEDAARRSYGMTVTLWGSRVNPALDHWVKQGRLTGSEADRIRGLSPVDQVPEVLKLEEKGIYFSKDLSKSILYSVAAPGTSQHLAMLALDVKEHGDEQVRMILARHGWYQTVATDLPHFTYLGMKESEMKALGLKRLDSGGRIFYVPELRD